MPLPLRLLIADEDADARGRMAEVVGELGAEVVVTVAASPAELEESVMRDRPDAVYIVLSRPDSAWTAMLTALQAEGRFIGAIVIVDAERSAARLQCVVDGLLAAARGRSRRAPQRAVDRLAVPAGGRISIVRVADLSWVEGAGTYVRLHTPGPTYLLRESLQSLAEQLDDHQFVRIHRSAIVNVDRVRALEHESRGEYRVYLSDGTELKLTRSYRDHLPRLTGALA